MDRVAPVAVLLAAGRGSRFDASGARNKLLSALPDGRLVCVAAAQALRAALPRVVAVVSTAQTEVAARLREAGCEVSICPDAAAGMGHSLAWGVQQAADASAWLIALADMPFLRAETVKRLLDQPGGADRIVVPILGGRRGHPVLFGRAHGAALMALQGDRGARSLLANHPVLEVAVDDPGVLRDIDTPADLDEPLPE